MRVLILYEDEGIRPIAEGLARCLHNASIRGAAGKAEVLNAVRSLVVGGFSGVVVGVVDEDPLSRGVIPRRFREFLAGASGVDELCGESVGSLRVVRVGDRGVVVVVSPNSENWVYSRCVMARMDSVLRRPFNDCGAHPLKGDKRFWKEVWSLCEDFVRCKTCLVARLVLRWFC